MAALVARPSVPVLAQLEDWAAQNGVMLIPRAYAFPEIDGTLSSASSRVQPDGGMIVVALVGITFDIGNTRVQVTNIESGGRRFVDGTLRLAALINGLESDGISALYLPAPIVVMPGDFIKHEESCEVAGETFANATGNNYETAAVGFALHDAQSGAMLGDDRARPLLQKLRKDLGEFRVLGVSGASAAIDTSESPMAAMTCEVVAAQGIAPTNTTSARLTLGTYELVPAQLKKPQALVSWRASGVVVNPNTRLQLRVDASATVRAHAAILGRRVEC